jgi:hypothetical protein
MGACLSQCNPIHTLSCCIFKLQFNIILLLCLHFINGLLPSKFQTKRFMHIPFAQIPGQYLDTGHDYFLHILSYYLFSYHRMVHIYIFKICIKLKTLYTVERSELISFLYFTTVRLSAYNYEYLHTITIM